ncbi:MAG: HAD-IIIA family hydrolase [Geobacteraceae bacterium]|nr:HAD-IIIA family hydrolase [Geobacteraceae bacterium]
MTVSVLLFDLDGTLVDSLDDLTDAVNHMLEHFGRQRLEPARVRQLVGKGARNLVQRALDTTLPGEIDRGLALFSEFNAQHIADKSRLYPGARELLQQMTDNGIRMAVISNKEETLSRLILETLGVAGFFGIIAGGDTFTEMKPSPLPLLRVIEEFACSPAEAVMVGDSINDIQAGNRAGIATIGCRWGYGRSEELCSADFQAATPGDVFGIITRAAQPNQERRHVMTQQPSDLYLKIKERHSDLIEAVEALSKTARMSGPLDEKTGHLIQLGAAAAIHSIGSVRSHAARALAAGATREEIHHAIIILTSTIGFPTVAAALSWIDETVGKSA